MLLENPRSRKRSYDFLVFRAYKRNDNIGRLWKRFASRTKDLHELVRRRRRLQVDIERPGRLEYRGDHFPPAIGPFLGFRRFHLGREPMCEARESLRTCTAEGATRFRRVERKARSFPLIGDENSPKPVGEVAQFFRRSIRPLEHSQGTVSTGQTARSSRSIVNICAQTMHGPHQATTSRTLGAILSWSIRERDRIERGRQRQAECKQGNRRCRPHQPRYRDAGASRLGVRLSQPEIS
jgi:hypothetical protein